MKNPFTIRADQVGLSLQQVLADTLKLSNKQAKALLDQRAVFVNGKRVWMCRHTVRQGDVLEVTGAAIPGDGSTPTKKITILYEDADCLVVDKPYGMLSNANPRSVEALLREKHPSDSLRAVHRLDRDTSGCLLFAKTPQAEAHLTAQFKDHAVKKIYHALVLGTLRSAEGVLRTPLDGQAAVTRYKRIATSPLLSFIHVEIETGRTHQIRRHFAAIDHPVAGDKEYGPHKVEDVRLRRIPRQMLHAATLLFTPPSGQEPVTVRAPEPKDFAQTRKQLLHRPDHRLKT
ncbi:MAG: RluA family pseudouridine synthase [Kiritimatiellae bacterium]|nr:RluA family pseudouridine synthase [Kiritimatiellia bacterium]